MARPPLPGGPLARDLGARPRRAMAFGAEACCLTRDVDDPHHFRQASIWEDHGDFERYWYTDESRPFASRRSTTTTSPCCRWHTLAVGEAPVETPK